MSAISPPPTNDLAAIVLADGPDAGRRVAGLSLAERARRVAARAGAARVLTIAGEADRAALAGWHRAGAPVLVLRARDQLVHTPLAADLVESDAPRALAVAPAAPDVADLAPGAYAGALLARGADADTVVAALARGDDDAAIAARLREAGAAAVPHGAIARHRVTSPDEARAAQRHLFAILHKAQDNVITRYLFRPVSRAMTAAVIGTPITPNQVSMFVAVLCALGIWLTARGPMSDALAGSIVILVATYVDCVDGEIARLKLLSSKLGAWFDTIVDELCSVAQVLALGWHCHVWFGPGYYGDLGFDPWMAAFWVSAVAYPVAIYCVYFNIIVVVGSANSQDYVHHFVVVDDPAAPGGKRLRPAPVKQRPRPKTALGRFIVEWVPHVIRRDFITWATVLLALAGWTHVAFLWMALGGAVTAPIVGYEHLRLRLLLRKVRAGAAP